MRFLVQLVKPAAIPQSTSDPKIRPVLVDRHGVGGIGLQLYGVRASGLGCFHDLERTRQFATMIGGQLGNDIGAVSRTDLPAGDFKLISHRPSCFPQHDPCRDRIAVNLGIGKFRAKLAPIDKRARIGFRVQHPDKVIKRSHGSRFRQFALLRRAA